MNFKNRSFRILLILEQLAVKKKVCIKKLAEKYDDIQERNLQKDFKEILREYFTDKLVKKNGCYFLINQEHFTNLFKSDPKTTREFLKLVHIVDSALYDKFIKENQELIKALKFTSSSIYQIQNSPYENLQTKHKETIDKLENAISKREYINIQYLDKNGSISFNHSIPIKILYLNENWYLVALTTNDLINNSAFKQLRISSIISIKSPIFGSKTFDGDNFEKMKAEKFTKNIQSAYSNMDKPVSRVLLRVSKEIARYFKKKKYLKSQRVIEELENGDIVVSYEICDDMEIIPIIQRWIPFIRVIKPLNIQKKIEENIRKFMNRN